jgi:hypothetical protein
VQSPFYFTAIFSYTCQCITYGRRFIVLMPNCPAQIVQIIIIIIIEHFMLFVLSFLVYTKLLGTFVYCISKTLGC